MINESIYTFWAGNVRGEADIFDYNSLYSRLTLWLKATDIFIYSFPFGVGEGLSSIYYDSANVPKYSAELLGLETYGR